MINAFRRSPREVVGLSIGLVLGLAITILFVVGLFGARLVDNVELIGSVLTAIGGCVVLGFIVLPLFFGVDDTLDPRKLSLFGIPDKKLATGLAIAALVGTPSLVLIICALASVVTWARNPGAAFIALICAIVAIATCVLAARVSTSLAAFLLATRRSREFSGLITVIVVLLLAPLVALLLSLERNSDAPTALNSVSNWLSWTPLGAIWAVPGDVLQGDWVQALFKFLIAGAFATLLWFVWVALVSRMLVAPERTGQARSYPGLGWFGRLPGRTVGSIAARATTYWGRDPRYWVMLVTIPVFPAFMVVALLVAGLPGHYVGLLPLPVMCLFLGWTIHNDVAYDSTAIWLHLVSGTRGYKDRLGRAFPVLLIGVPLIAVGSIVTAYVYGDFGILAPTLGLSTSILLIGIGMSSIASALFPYPATNPGDSAFSQPQSAGGSAVLIQSASFVAILVLASPTVIFFALGLFSSAGWLVVATVVGFGIGAAILALGITAGGRAYDSRGPELIAFAIRNG